MPSSQTILHPTDFSENARPAFKTACAMARDSHAKLLVLHIMARNVSPLADAGFLNWDDDGTVHVPDAHQSAEAQEALVRLPWPRLSDPQIRVEYRLAEGDPVEEILRLTERLRCNLIVMGTHGKTGLSRLLTGSVAEEVLRRAACPVLVARTPLEATPGAGIEATADPGEPIDVRPLGTALASAHTRTLVRTSEVKVVRLIVREGQEIPEQTSQGETLVHCLEGRVDLTALGRTQVLEAGALLVLPAGEPHALEGIEDASLLLTTFVPRS